MNKPAATAAIILLTTMTIGGLIMSTPTTTPAGLPATAPVPGVFQPLGLDSDHSGFPTATELPDGRIRLMWRHGSSHASADGEILTSVSDEHGANWSTPEHVAVDNGPDLRDPHLGPSGLSAVGSDVFLTYFVEVNDIPSGARVARSTDGGATFQDSVRIDPNMPWAAISSPVVRSPNGKLWTGFYGKNAGESAPSAYAAWSLDNGATWANVRIANAKADSTEYAEPWAVVNGTTVAYMFRDGNWDAIASRTVPETYPTSGTWSPIHHDVITAATGNSATVRGSNGKLYMVYRSTTTLAAMLASSSNGGTTWKVERELMPKPAGATSAIGMTYAHPIELANGYIFCPMGMERADTDSRIYLGYL